MDLDQRLCLINEELNRVNETIQNVAVLEAQTRVMTLPGPAERRRYALLQAATAIILNERFQNFHDLQSTPVEQRSIVALDFAELLLAEIEKREKP